MLRQNAHRMLFLACLTTLGQGSSAHGQITAQLAREDLLDSNRSCGVLPCPPRVLTYGFYHENWRRWPEESSATGGADLSPFALPDRTVPPVEVPDPRDEGTVSPRRRQSTGAEPPAAALPEPAPFTQPPGKQPAPGRPTLDELPSDLPVAPAEQGELDQGRSFFPDSDIDTGRDDGLPNTFPESGTDSSGSGGNAFPELPPMDDPAPSSDGDVNDLFDLDEFGQADPRMRRYQQETASQLRRAGVAETVRGGRPSQASAGCGAIGQPPSHVDGPQQSAGAENATFRTPTQASFSRPEPRVAAQLRSSGRPARTQPVPRVAPEYETPGVTGNPLEEHVPVDNSSPTNVRRSNPLRR